MIPHPTFCLTATLQEREARILDKCTTAELERTAPAE